MGRLDGKVTLISGGARGMGAAEAAAFVAEGARVMVADVLDDEAGRTAAALGEAGASTHLDVTDEGSWQAAVAATTDRFGRLDVLVNNAGILRVAALTDCTADEFMRVVEVNQLGVFLGMKAAVAALAATGNGSIVNISSVAGLVGSAGHVAYCSTKWAVRGMTKVAAIELAPMGIRVNSIHPGLIDTPMLGEYRSIGADPEAMARGVALGRLATADDVAPLALFLASDESRYSTGSEFVVDGGLVTGRLAGGQSAADDA